MPDWSIFDPNYKPPEPKHPDQMSIGDLFETCPECEGPLEHDGQCKWCPWIVEPTVDQVEARRQYLIDHPEEWQKK